MKGYTLGSLQETQTGLTAHLSLGGPACNAFGQDISDLTIQITYESQTRSALPLSNLICPYSYFLYHRLHVNIFDTAEQQFTVPESVVQRPSPPITSHKNSSDLVFNYDSTPFAFWITRRSDPAAMPLFDTRIASLPQTPIAPVIATDNSTALDSFPLVFEDQYLQVIIAVLCCLPVLGALIHPNVW